MKAFLRHTATGTRYEVLSLDKTTGLIRLKGQYATFEEPYDPARFKALGYTLEKETHDA
jgi:hypothetical protein